MNQKPDGSSQLCNIANFEHVQLGWVQGFLMSTSMILCASFKIISHAFVFISSYLILL